jgi:CheY-like chemotaxis protein
LSLTGNLEDLPLLDIIQIVSFSKKTGHLSIVTGEGEGGIVFEDGLVVAAFAAGSPPLDARFEQLSAVQRGAVIRTRIEMALEQLIRLREGQFSFALADEAPSVVGTRDLGRESLITGINAQELLLDLARGLDEDRRHSSAAVEASFAEAPDPPEEVIVVDDPLPPPTPAFDTLAALEAAVPASPTAPETGAADRARAESAETPPLGVPSIPTIATPEMASFLKDQRHVPPRERPGAATVRMPAVRDVPPFAPPPKPPPPPEPIPPPEEAPPPEATPPQEATPPRDATPPPEATPPPLATPPPPRTPEPARTILLVDDEDDVRKFLSGIFVASGYDVVEASDPESAVKTGGKLGNEKRPFVLVTDLGMPASGGASFHGGFEVVKRLWKMNLRPPVLMMTDSLSQALQLRARQMGVKAFVFKPGLSKLNPGQFEADLKAFAAKILADILPRLAASPQALSPRVTKEAKAPPVPGAAAPAPSLAEEELSRDFAFLQRRLAELRRPGNANQIAVLVMKVAREFFERAILFLVKNEEARGLGGFGAAPKEESLSLLVRQVVIPLGEPSPFLDAVESGKPRVGPLPPGKWSNYLIGRIGRFHSGTVAILPLVTHRETIALLFGDNPETGSEFPRLDALEVFIHQAGIALENAFLQKKLQAFQEKT